VRKPVSSLTVKIGTGALQESSSIKSARPASLLLTVIAENTRGRRTTWRYRRTLPTM
jgi:hypothetical protein